MSHVDRIDPVTPAFSPPTLAARSIRDERRGQGQGHGHEAPEDRLELHSEDEETVELELVVTDEPGEDSQGLDIAV